MITPWMSILLAYLACSAEAEVRVLTSAEAVACAEVYTDLKLGFIEVPDRAALFALDPQARRAAGRTAYRGWVRWQTENAALHAWLMAEARRNARGY